MRQVLGIDVGGTTTRVIVIDEDDAVRFRRRFPTRPGSTVQDVVGAAGETGRCAAAGLALPGPLSTDGESVGVSVNCPHLVGLPLRTALGAAFACPVHLITDVEAAALAEWRSLDRTATRMAHLRLGTGVGCAVLVDGVAQPLQRVAGRHVDELLVPDERYRRRCSCGGYGCLEAVASGRALAEGGDEALAVEAALLVLGSLVRRFALDAVVVGGGLVENREAIGRMLAAGCHERGLPYLPAALGDWAGAIGSASFALASAGAFADGGVE